MTKTKAETQAQQIKNWFDKAYPEASDRDLHNQVAEHLTGTLGVLLSYQEIAQSSSTREEIGFSTNVIDFIQRRIRTASAGIELAFSDLDRASLLLALCAQIRSCIGLAHMLEMDIEGALTEMIESDITRLGVDGHPIFNDKNRLVDGNTFRRPNYIQFI